MRNICSPHAPRQTTSIESLSPKMGDWAKYQRASWSAWQFPGSYALLPLALQAQGFYSLPWSRGMGVLNKMLWATTFPAAGLPRGPKCHVHYPDIWTETNTSVF